MLRRIFTLAIAALPILAGLTISGVTIARADSNGTCIYAPGANPVSGYPTLPACTGTRTVLSSIADATNKNASALVATPSDGFFGQYGVFSVDQLAGYNGSTWDRLRETSGILNTLIADNAGNQAQTTIASDGLTGRGLLTYGGILGYNGTSWDRVRTEPSHPGIQEVSLYANNGATVLGTDNNGHLWTNTGGGTLTTASATTCTAVKATPWVVHKIWAAGAETATLAVYADNGTCAAADMIYNKIPPNGTPDTLDAPVTAYSYKLSAAPAVNDFILGN